MRMNLNYYDQQILIFISTNSGQDSEIEKLLKNRPRDNDQAPFLVYVHAIERDRSDIDRDRRA